MTTQKWTEERTEQLKAIVAGVSPVSKDLIEQAAETLETTVRSVASKLRKLGIEVVSLAKVEGHKFSDEDANQLRAFVEANAGQYTYAEIAAAFLGGKYSTKSIQGKLLSMELTKSVKPTEKVEVARTYTSEEETKFISMAQNGAFIEDIATALNKSTNSIRGKALSFLRNGQLTAIPAQKESKAKNDVDPIEALGDIASFTVAEIATKVEKTERGIRTMLTRRGLVCADYDGASKKAKLAEKQTAVAA